MFVPRSVENLLEWHRTGDLNLRPEFQRRSNWPSGAQCYFIDTILRGFPAPLLYVRPTTNPKTKKPVNEVVDGQQRLTAIIEFFEGRLRLDKQTREFEGLTYQDLDLADQEKFLKYEMGVEELYNASDDFVLDVFHRLNAYGVKLNSQELRHGRFQEPRYRGAFRLEVIQASKKWAVLWDRHKVVSLKGRMRMADDELMAQMLGVVLNGVCDGGQPKINELYVDYDNGVLPEAIEQLDRAIDFILKTFPDVFKTRLKGGPHFLILFAAVVQSLFGLKTGDMGKNNNPPLPARDGSALSDIPMARANLMLLARVLSTKESAVPPKFFDFKLASAGTTQRIRSRSNRFVFLYRALLPQAMLW